jgi:hypothetical protein
MQPLTASSLAQVTVAEPQLSLAVTPALQPGMLVGLQPRFVLLFEQLSNVGGVVSTVQVTVLVHVAVFRQSSVAVYIRVRVWTQPLTASSLAQVTVAEPQLSLAVTPVSQTGTLAGLQPRFVLVFEQLSNVGGVSSSTVMICWQLFVLPPVSVAVYVRVIV